MTSFDVFSKVNIKYDLLVLVLYMCLTYFRQYVVSFKKIQNYVLFYQESELELAPDKKFPELEPPKTGRL